LPDTACIAFRLQTAVYKPFFIEVWGDAIDTIKFPHNTEEICEPQEGLACSERTPCRSSYLLRTRSIANDVYDHWAQSIDQYETSPDVSAFSSKFDAFLHDPATNPLTGDEMTGYNLSVAKRTATPAIWTADPQRNACNRHSAERRRYWRCGRHATGVHLLRLG